jgi:tetratricopeptide (TPR) repeat protein
MKRIIIALCAVSMYTAAQAQDATLAGGIKMYMYQKYQSAQKILTPLAATDPQANYYLGLSYLDAGNVQMASTTFQKFPEDPANISGMARVAFVNKDVAKGTQMAKDLAAKSKKKEWIQEKYAADAITYTNGGDNMQAIAWYKDAITKSDNIDTHIGLGDAYRKVQGGGGDAMTNYESVTEKDPKNSLGYTRIGDLWYEAHNYPSALDNYGKAKDADPSNPLPYKSLANAYRYSGRYQQAYQNFKQYVQYSDNTLSDKIMLDELMYQSQSSCDAVQYTNTLLSDPGLTHDQVVELNGILGYSLADCGDSIKALTVLHNYFGMQDPSKIKPGDYLQLGKLFLKLGQLDSAGYYYNKGIAGDTAQNKTDVYRTIAEAFMKKKDYCKSADWYNNLVVSNPNTQPGDYAWRTIMYYYCQSYDKSLSAATDFVKKYPEQPSASYWQARSSAAIDSDATTGGAVDYFNTWLTKVGPNYEKKNDLKGAYSYLMYYYYNKKDKDNEKKYMDLILAIDPNDKSVHEIQEAEKAPAKKPAPAKGKK